MSCVHQGRAGGSARSVSLFTSDTSAACGGGEPCGRTGRRELRASRGRGLRSGGGSGGSRGGGGATRGKVPGGGCATEEEGGDWGGGPFSKGIDDSFCAVLILEGCVLSGITIEGRTLN